jgi:hypothetical protein
MPRNLEGYLDQSKLAARSSRSLEGSITDELSKVKGLGC